MVATLRATAYQMATGHLLRAAAHTSDTGWRSAVVLGDNRGTPFPGFVMQISLGYLAARTYGIHYRPQILPMKQRTLLGAFSGLLTGISINVRPTYIAPLCFVVALVFIVDPVWRIAWKRAQTSAI